jgi:biopolymer transport protein ExbB
MKSYLLALTLAVTGLLLGTAPAPAQTNAAPEAAAAEAAGPHKKTLWEQIKEGGWVMFPIAACSILTVYLIWDGAVRTGRKRTSPPEHEEAIKNYFRQGDYLTAYKFCNENPSALTNVLKVGISLLGEGKTVAEEGMLTEMSKENGKMNTYISYLSVIGVCTPMIGLLGTVTGMIRAFATLSTSGIGDPSKLSGAIGEVLVATASGLFIAIPAFGAFYFLRNRAMNAMHHIQDNVHLLFRKMPYDQLEGAHIGGDELYAAAPNWTTAPQA